MIESNSIAGLFSYDICPTTGRNILIYYSDENKLITLKSVFNPNNKFKHILDFDLEQIDGIIIKIVVLPKTLIFLTTTGIVYNCISKSKIEIMAPNIFIRDIFYGKYSYNLYGLDIDGRLWQNINKIPSLMNFNYEHNTIRNVIPGENLIMNNNGDVYKYSMSNGELDTTYIGQYQSIRAKYYYSILLLNPHGELFELDKNTIKPILHNTAIKFYNYYGYKNYRCVVIYDIDDKLYLQHDDKWHRQYFQHSGNVIDIICTVVDKIIIVTDTNLYFYNVVINGTTNVELVLTHCEDNYNPSLQSSKSARKV